MVMVSGDGMPLQLNDDLKQAPATSEAIVRGNMASQLLNNIQPEQARWGQWIVP